MNLYSHSTCIKAMVEMKVVHSTKLMMTWNYHYIYLKRYIYKTSGYIQNNGHLYIPNVLLVHLSQTNEDKFHHGWKVVSLVPKRDAYIYQLKTNNAIAPCNESFRTFVVQDISEENLLLKVIIFMLN